MKKLISLIIAMTMVSSLFAVSVFATEPDPFPTTVTLSFDVAVADADLTEIYVDEMGAVASGYTLYAVTVSQTGLGEWRNTSTGGNSAKKKATGWLPSGYQFELDFGSDIDNVGDAFVAGPIAATDYDINGSVLYAQFAFSGGDYPLNSVNGDAVAVDEGEAICVWLIPINGSATATVTNTTQVVMSDYSANSMNTLAYNGEDAYGYTGAAVLGEKSVAFGASTTYYTVTFMNGSSQVSTKDDYESGDALVVPSDPTPAAGYTFAGWALGSADNAVSDLTGATVSADATYYAKFTQNDYTVTFYNGETPVSTKTDYHYGDTLVAPADPSKAGFTFSGWSTSPSGAVEDLPATVTGGATYYAQFAEAGPSLPADIERKAGRDIAKFTSANGALKTLKKDQFATVETDADYYVTEFDTNALDFAGYDYAIKATADDESTHTFDKIDGANLAEVGGNINFFVIIKKVTDRAHEIVNIVVKAFEK